MAAVGAAVTYSNVSATRVSYQKALDGAVLAGTILPGSASVAGHIKAAEVVFAAGITGQVQSVTVASSTRFKVDTLGSDDVKVTGEASAEVKNLFGSSAARRSRSPSTPPAARANPTRSASWR